MKELGLWNLDPAKGAFVWVLLSYKRPLDFIAVKWK